LIILSFIPILFIMGEDDKKLVADFLNGDDGAFEQLLGKYLKPVYNFLYQLTNDKSALDDLAQESFIKAWKNIKKFDKDRNFKTWLFTIAKNTAYDYFKKKKAIPFSSFANEEGDNKLENIIDESIFPDELLMRADAANILEEKLQELPEHYRIILTLHYIEDFSLTEIAEILKIPYNTAKSQHQRGLLKLRKLLEQI
jgi:RNA polymerase sigma-70 factor (ECF subfamily)